MIPNVLTIAGTDPTGGAGVQADLKTFSALGAYGMDAITAVVAQNTCGVRSFQALDPAFVAAQIDAVFDDVRVDAVKIGMIATAGIVDAIVDRLEYHRASPVILDPVMVAKSGDHLLLPEAIDIVRTRLIPRSTLITPNLPEAAVLLDTDEPQTMDEMRAILPALRGLGAEWVLLKGGHLAGDESVDFLAGPDGITELRAARVATRNTHGTGCTLSAAIAALVPRLPMEESVRRAKAYLSAALAHADELDVGHGHGPVHHFHGIWRDANGKPGIPAMDEPAESRIQTRRLSTEEVV